ncbi:uncharacterized protein [Triticum aestivum]|uniref:uncharacterized protein isoform X2 n=1 Tax=Triticum aestivum TaxID=4565 RepID=UPI001D00E696|nr:uncharacterized protein LOC123087119 isoform X2 [Triticum aestivum]
MVCPVCRCPGAACLPFVPTDEVLEVFYVVLDEYCFRRTYIPCNVRGFLADYIAEHRHIATTYKHKRTEPAILIYESRSYASEFKHRGNYSKFCGSAWFEFSNDYALRAEDRLVFTLDNSCFDLKVETFRDGERILPLPSVAFENLSNARYELVCSAVMPRGLEFNYHNNRLLVHSLFRTSSCVRCTPFVHVMTATNTMKFTMKMASDTNDLEDSEVMYRDDDLDETFASQSQFEGQTHSLNVGGGDPQFDVKNFLNNLRNLFYSSNENANYSKNPCRAPLPPKKATSRCNHGYFSDLLKKIPPSRLDVIKNYGCSFILDFDCNFVPRGFAQWIAGKVNPPTGDIVLDNKVIPMSPESFHLLLGLPLGGTSVLFDSEVTKAAFLNIIGEPTLPSIKWFGLRVLKPDISDIDFLRCFLLVAFATVLCPNSNIYPSTKYLGILIDPTRVTNYDLSKFVFDWLM